MNSESVLLTLHCFFHLLHTDKSFYYLHEFCVRLSLDFAEGNSLYLNRFANKINYSLSYELISFKRRVVQSKKC